MAKTAKTTASKAKTPAAETKTAKVSAPAEKKAEEKTAAKTAVKAAAPVKTASKSTAKTTVKATEKAPAVSKAVNTEKADVKPEIFVEFGNAQVSIEKVAEDAKKKYAADGNKEEIKSLKIYLKPEEQLAYYVINDTVSDKMDVFFY